MKQLLLTGDCGPWDVPDMWEGAASLVMTFLEHLRPSCLACIDMETNMEPQHKINYAGQYSVLRG